MTLVRVIFPPQFEPFQTYLSGPYLKGLLSSYGVRSYVFDANVHFFNWLVSRGTVGDAYLAAHVGEALEAIRKAPTDLLRYRWAINVVDRYLEAAASSSGRLGLSRFEIEDRFNSEALRAWSERDELFRDYFEQARQELLGDPSVESYLFSVVVMDQLGPAIVLAKEMRKHRPGARMFVGGPLISRLRRQLSGLPWLNNIFDAIVPGEAYSSLPRLLGLSGTPPYAGHVTPDFRDIDWDAYWSCRRVLPYLVAHGCKWGKCTFCSHHLTYDGYRSSEMDKVLEDLERLAVAHGIEYVSFSDEYLTPPQLTALAGGLTERDLSLRWLTFARPEPAFKKADWVNSLYDGGCRILMFGLESGSQRIVSAMRKGTRVDNFRPILESCKSAGIAIRYDFMVGFPGETVADVAATYDFIRSNREVIDTPFSSYSVAAFELRGGVPVEQAREEYGISGADLLRGDLDDQYEFETESGLSETERTDWRARFIRLGKEELAFDIICPQNKTDQLVFKDLYDRGDIVIPPTDINTETACRLKVKFAPPVIVTYVEEGMMITNPATGGALAIGEELADVIDLFQEGGYLSDAAILQDSCDLHTFWKLVNFLYRNDYLTLEKAAYAKRERREALPYA